MIEYAATYGGLPRPTDPWPLVMAGIRRLSRFDARARIRLFDSVADAIAAAFGDDGAADHRETLHAVAYPGSPSGGVALIPNLARLPSEDHA